MENMKGGSIMVASRPTHRDSTILLSVAQKVLAAMPSGTIADSDTENALNDIVNALRREAPGFDEYRMTRYLEESGWACDRTIMDAFDIAGGEAFHAVREATKQWVRANSIKPRLSVGAQVKVMARAATMAKEEFDGEVVTVDAEQAAYTVMIPALGHVREGNGTHGIIFHFEELHPLATPAEEFCLEPS